MHAMATCFSGVENTPVENPKTQDVDNVSEDESQDEDLSDKYFARQQISNSS